MILQKRNSNKRKTRNEVLILALKIVVIVAVLQVYTFTSSLVIEDSTSAFDPPAPHPRRGETENTLSNEGNAAGNEESTVSNVAETSICAPMTNLGMAKDSSQRIHTSAREKRVPTASELALIGAPWRVSSPRLPEHPTSFDILHCILSDNNVGNVTVNPADKGDLPGCLVPNHSQTEALVKAVSRGRRLSLPVLNMGMPKVGSQTLEGFFKCAGLRTCHNQCGNQMMWGAQIGEDPLARCHPKKDPEAFLQMDVSKPPKQCYYPQVQLLDEIHRRHPNATFVLAFRPVDDWIHSVRAWRYGGFAARLVACDLPGLPEGAGGTARELREWYCGHVWHVRDFAARHPSHALVELDLYDTARSSRALATLFRANEGCWGHVNANPKIKSSGG